MFESVIQKILLLLFGRFIDGLDRKQISLSLSSGDLVIENVSIKREALEALQLPITLVYSAIQRIEVKLPWKNLNTQRTEIKIHSVFLLVTTLQENMWRLSEINCYKPKAEQVRMYIKKIMDEEIRKQKLSTEDDGESQQQTGFFQKHITRIVDNLYIQIQQVHFRYEHCISKHSFSWGITINQITQQTVDSEWKTSNPPYFHDRKELAYVNKQIQLSKLAMYWNSDDHFLILNTVIKEKRWAEKMDEKTQARIQQLMQQELVYEPDNSTMGIRTSKSSKYIFCLNAVANVVQTYLHARKVPEYKIKVELQEMDFKIKHTQYKEIMKQISIFNKYQFGIKQIIDQDITIISKPQMQNYKMDTMRLYYTKLFRYIVNMVIMELRRKKFMEIELKALRSKTSSNIMLQKQENRKDMRPYQNIIRQTELSMLQQWAKQALEIHQTAKENYQIEQALRKELERAYKPAHPDEETYVYLEFRLLIIKGSLKLMRKHKNLEEGFTLLWKNFDYNLQMRKNNFEIEQVIQDMEVQMFSVEEKNDIIVPIVKKIKSYEIEEKPLIYFKLEKHPLQKPNYFSSIQLEVQKIEVMVFVASLRRVMAYFRMPPQDDRQQEVKEQKQNKQTKQPTETSTIEPHTKNYISITIQSPIVIVPNQQINDLHSDCWVLKLGDFEIITVEEKQQQVLNKLSSDQSKKVRLESISRSRIVEQPMLTVHNERNQLISTQQFNFNVIEKSTPPQQYQLEKSSLERSSNLQFKKNAKYDNYVMKLKSVQLQYFSSIHYFYNHQKLSQTKKGLEILNNTLRVRSKKYDVLEEFSMELNLFFSKTTGQAQTKINFELPYLKASINPEIPFTISKLLQTINDLSQDQSLSSILQQEKAKLIKYSSCRGLLRKRGKFLRSWSSYFAVLSGWYIYLYQNESDSDYSQYVGLRDVVVSEAQNDIGVLNSFKIKSKKEIIYFQAKSPQEKNRWFKFIQQKIHDIKSKTNVQKIGSENTVQQAADKNKPQNEQREQAQDNQDLVTRYRFQIKKFLIELKLNSSEEILIAFDQIKLKSLAGLSESYQEFSINFISVINQGLTIMRSIQYSQPTTPLHKSFQPKKVKNHTVIQFKNKMEQVRSFLKDSQPITDALKVRISQFDTPVPNQPSTYIVIEFSSLEARYLESFLAKISKFIVQPSLQKNNKDSTTDLDNLSENQTQTMKYSAMPVSETRYMQTKQDYTRVNIKSIRSFTLQKSSVSDSEVHELIQKEADQPQHLIKVTIVTQEIKLIVMIQETEKSIPQEFLEIWVQQISSTLNMSDECYDIQGEIQTIEIIDLKSISQRHIFLGKNTKQQNKKAKNITIFSNLPKYEESMLSYGFKKFRFPSEEYPDKFTLRVKNCSIDYLHATIVKVLSLLEIAQKKKQTEENEQDLELIRQKITKPALIVVSIELNNPRILIKPAGQETQQFELQIDQVTFDLSASREKNRIIESLTRTNKKQQQLVGQFDPLWCQTIVVTANTMHIQIRNADELQSISNSFSGVLRLQTPMFVNEYETVFPNIVINKTQEIRIKVTDIQLNIQRNHYLFLLQVMQTQYQIQTMKTQQKKKQTQQQPKKQPSQVALIFKLSSACVKLIEIYDQDQIDHQLRPLVDLTLMDIQFTFKQNIELMIKDFKSTYYQYQQDYVRIQSTINSLHAERKKMEFFFQEEKKQPCRIEDLINDNKQEFYKESTPSKNDIEEKFNVKVILGEDLTEVNIRIGETKYLISAYCLKTISQFFAIPKDDDENRSQDAPIQRKEIKQKESLLNLNVNVQNIMLILHTDTMRNCLVLQIDSNLKMTDEFYNDAHQNYHAQLNEAYNSNSKTRKMELQINTQIYNCQYAAIQKIKPYKKKMILNKIRIDFLRHQFLCECQGNYCNYSQDHDEEQVANLLTLDQLKFEKIRINISHNDYALITQIIKFQKEQLKQCEKFFIDDEESSIHETMAKLQPLQPSLHPDFDKSIQRFDSKRRSYMHSKSFLLRSKSSMYNSQLKDEVAQVFYAAGEQDMEIVKEEDAQSDQDQQVELQKPIVKINKMEMNLDFLEIVLVNDNNKSFAPLLLFRFNIKNFLFDQNYVSMALKFQFLIELMYFNPVVSRMEPVIEPYSSELLMVKQKSQMQTIHINSITPVLNINLATEMVLNLYKTFTQWQFYDQSEEDTFKRSESKKMTRMPSMKAINNRENQDTVTLFSLVNKTGYNIRVCKTDNDEIGDIGIEVQNTEQKNYEVFSHDEDYEKTFESDTKITIKFIDALMSQTVISNVPINYAGIKKLQFEDSQHYYVLSTQIENLQKSITIYSPYMLVNHTDCELQIKLSDIKNTRTYKLKPGEQAAVPQELYKDECYVLINFMESKFTKCTTQSEPIFIKRIFNEVVMEIFHRPCYTLATVNTTIIQNVRFIEFKPAFIIYNLLPIPLQFMFHSPQNQELQRNLMNHFKQTNQSGINVYEKQQSAISRGNSLTHLQNEGHDNLIRSVTVTEFNHHQTIKIEGSLIEIVPQGELQLHCLEKTEQLFANIHLSGFELSKQIDLSQATEIQLRDSHNQNVCHIRAEKDYIKQTKMVYFSVHTCIINTTCSKLKYYTLIDDKPVLLPGQSKELRPDRESFESNYDKIQVTDSIKYLMIGMENGISNEVNVGILGSVGLQLKQKSEKLYQLHEYGIHISLSNNVIKKGVYTKVIEIMPRFVIINNTEVNIQICQSGFENSYMKLSPNERYHLVWPDCRLEKSIRIQKSGKYNWSGDLYINEIRSTSFYSNCANENSQQFSNVSFEQRSRTIEKSGIYKQFNLKKYDPQDLQQFKEQINMQTSMLCQSNQEFFKDCLFLTAEITRVKATNFILLEQQNEENLLYKLVNRCRPFKLQYGQDCYNSCQEWILDCDQSSPFSWEQPSHSYKLRVKFIHNNKVEHIQIIDFQQQEALQEIQFCEHIIRITSEFQKQTRVITFQQINEVMRNTQQSHRADIDDIQSLIQMNIKEFGISIITNIQNKLLEANYIYLSGIELGMMQSQRETTAQLRIKFFNIDNNTSIDTTTPVLMTMRRYYQVTHDRNYYFLDASCSLEHQVKAILLYNSIRIFIQPFQLQLDEEYIQVMLQTLKQIKQSLQNQFEFEFNGSTHSIKSLCFQTPLQRHYYLEQMQQLNQSNPCIQWKSIDINRSKKQVYIKEFLLSKIDLRFSFHKRFKNNNNIQYDENLFNLFSTAIGATVQNFNDAEIILDCFRLRQVYDSKEIVLGSIQDHYKSEIIRAILKIIGSIEIIGNPVKFVQQITNGVVDFVEMPYQGLKHGPLEFGVGLCKGTGSLLKNTVAGAFQSVNKVTGSISASVSLLTMDDDYLEKRRIFMLKRPDHVLDGLSQAGHCLYSGFTNGITGVVMQPYQETQKDGFKGLVKGTLKGLSGLVVKPIAGVLDASAKAAEGVVSTATHFDDKPNDSRIRYPRIFYEKSQYYQKYIPLDSQVKDFLITFQNGKYRDIELIACFSMRETEAQLNSMQRQILSATKSIHECFKQTSKILIISYQYIIVLENMQLMQEFKPEDITEIYGQNMVFLDGQQLDQTLNLQQISQKEESPDLGELRIGTEFKKDIELITLTKKDFDRAHQLLKYLKKQDEKEFS